MNSKNIFLVLFLSLFAAKSFAADDQEANRDRELREMIDRQETSRKFCAASGSLCMFSCAMSACCCMISAPSMCVISPPLITPLGTLGSCVSGAAFGHGYLAGVDTFRHWKLYRRQTQAIQLYLFNNPPEQQVMAGDPAPLQ